MVHEKSILNGNEQFDIPFSLLPVPTSTTNRRRKTKKTQKAICFIYIRQNGKIHWIFVHVDMCLGGFCGCAGSLHEVSVWQKKCCDTVLPSHCCPQWLESLFTNNAA